MAVVGCTEAPSVTDIANADFGSQISQSECQRIAKGQILPRLKDPNSAQFSFGTCEKRSLGSIPIKGIPVQYGYLIVASTNAKNSYGGYVGAQNWETLINNGQVIRRTAPTSDGFQIPY
tara:strand:- start:360 stop:716 length:357 start_codon:yes stop_codon:yes gene_type:complete